ncbi:hypothetical protein OEZ85_005325 [Tetradesmus obliquus]|uniref:AMP-dependent synthetase/ligase domain-containing protein n=1 Tax=Tetradesmus obliquus TaxID=3088 RepID=A0ABY8UN05_TETOB|nr:hypothetical protein OEZ85_005325 [Tetradesmus obliquus]
MQQQQPKANPVPLTSRFGPPCEAVATLHDCWQAAVGRFPAERVLGWRLRDSSGRLQQQYNWMTFAQACEVRDALGSGLLAAGIPAGSALGLYSSNCPHWVLLDAAAAAYSMVSVPLYDSLGPQAVQYIINHAELAAQPQPHVSPRPGDTATICYTSGTTGMPKGAVLSHGNLIANAAGSAALMAQQGAWGPGDTHLSFLPLAHIFERKNLTLALHYGLAIGFYSGDARRVFEDAAVLRPSLFMAVPRVFNRLHDEVMAEVQQGSALRQRLFQAAYARKAKALEAGEASGGLPLLLDRVAFGWVRQRLGGRVRYMTTGASPISAAVLTFLRVCITPAAVEGYGMTEAGCTISIGRPGDTSCGHVGLPLPCCEVALAELPALGYSTADRPHPRGEVCVRGPSVFRGYHRAPQATAQALDSQSWLHTGDVGEWLPGGRLRLIDRKNSLFKLAQGEYVAPERLEAVYARSPLVLQVFVTGDSLQQQPVAVVVPDPEALQRWAAQHSTQHKLQGMLDLCAEPAAVQAVHGSLLQQAAEAGLQGYEAVAGVVLVPQPFSVENGLLTPTQKLRRQVARQRFADAVQAVYRSLPGSRRSEA